MKNCITTRTWLKLLLCAFVSQALGTSADAARVHLKSVPTVQDLGTNLETCLSLAGLGNKDVTIIAEVEGTASVTYINPGGNKPAGQNKFPVAEISSVTVPSNQVKNGTVSVCLTSPNVDPGDAPNPNWTVQLDDVEFESVTIPVIQGGKVVLKKTVNL